MGIISRLRIRSRLLLAVLLPILITAVVVAWVTVNQLQHSGDAELERLRENLMMAHKKGLKHVVETARSAIEADYGNASLDEAEAKKRVRAILRSIEFGDNNYIFAWTHDNVNLAYRPNPSREGKSKDSSPAAKALLRNLVKAAQSGGGFHAYTRLRPSTNKQEPKISYSIALNKWDWIMGAGIYVTDVDETIAAARAELDAQISASLGRIFGITAVIVTIAALFGIFVGSTVTRPLSRVTRIMREIAEGDGDLTQRLPDQGSDELSELGRRFNAFVGKIQAAIVQVGETTEQLASAAEELSHIAGETHSSVQKQGVETDQIASAINEMAATVHQISMNANQVESAASDADTRARDGGKIVLSSQQSVQELSAILQESARSIESLAARSGDIQSVLDVIHDVTEQTNLLALNAAIEAARAGEHGRGFAVVADEVRQLARRSGESASQIRDMIDGFVAESGNAVERMRASQGQSEETIGKINEAASALVTIEGAVERIHDQVTQIATAAEEQSSVAEEINKSVVSIVNAAAQSETGVSQTSDASHELARLGENLRRLVSQFRVR